MQTFERERAVKICEDIGNLITLQSSPIAHWQMKKGEFLTPAEADLDKSKWLDFSSNDDVWRGHEQHYWFRTIITVPKSFDKQNLWLNIATQINFWDAVNPQFLLFVNGKVTQGVDINHREILLSESAIAGEKITVDLQAFSGRNSDQPNADTASLKLIGFLSQIDEKVKALYYNLKTPLEILTRLNDQSQEYIKIIQAVTKAINILDLRVPYSNEFYESVDCCNEFLTRSIYCDLALNKEIVATCVGHTHIDIAWWWTVEQTRQKVCRSFATVLKLMNEYPDYKFMSSQPQLYKFFKQRYPDVYEEIKQRIKEGRWEVEGGMWLEADCNVTSGESLVRQFLYGKKFFKEEFGKDNVILWLPDVFGYSGALPQIMKKCGIKYFMTTKIAWNQFNKLPADTFWWRGIDSSEVFTHLITTQDEDQAPDSFYTTYNGKLTPKCVMRAWERYQHKDLNTNVLISYGYGDGGGGPTREMLEYAKHLKSGIIGAPKVKLDTARKYFDNIYKNLADNKKLPTWVGELYLEYHRGTYTSMARNKKGNRMCEFLWQDVEFFSVLAKMLGEAYPENEINDSWELILLNQFHDILPGSSIKEVYDVTKVEYEQLIEKAEQIIKNKLCLLQKNIKANQGDIIVYNTLSFQRDDIVCVENCDFNSVADSDGQKYPVQKTYDDKLIFVAKNINPKGYSIYTPTNDIIAHEKVVSMCDNKITTPYYEITFDEKLQFSSVFDRQAKREVLKPGQKGNVLRVYEDKPIYYDNWDIDIYYKEKSWIVDDVENVEWIENGAVRATLLITRKFLNSTIEQKIHFYAHTKRIDFETYVDWKQFNLLLKAEFAVKINATEATYDIQFGNIKRPNHKNTSWDKAKFEVCAHKWADLSEGNFGVAILNDCKYGYSICDSEMAITLIKSGTVPNPVTDQEEHYFTYSFMSHEGDWKDGCIEKEGYCLNVKPYAVVSAQTNDKEMLEQSFVCVDCDNVIIGAIKQSEDSLGVVIRMYEYYNNTSTVKMKLTSEFTRVIECDMLENNITELNVVDGNCEFLINPYEIKTFKLIK